MADYDLAGNPLPDSSAPPARDINGNPISGNPLSPNAPRSTVPMRYDLAGNPLPGSPTPQNAEPVRYDLAGNPLPPPASGGAPQMRYDLAGNALPPLAAAPAPALGTWPPPPTAAGYSRPLTRNTSGEQADVPPEIARLKWNWGAFFFPIFWCRKHGMTTLAGGLVGGLFVLRLLKLFLLFVNPLFFVALYWAYALAYFGIQLYFGSQGHQIAWRNRRFDGGVEEFFKVQRAWMLWGIGVNVVLGVILPLMMVLGVIHLLGSASSGSGSPPPSAYGSYGSGYGGYSR